MIIVTTEDKRTQNLFRQNPAMPNRRLLQLPQSSNFWMPDKVGNDDKKAIKNRL
jgi:alanyl-tRNA synthetase